MTLKQTISLASCAVMLVAAGCKKTADNSINYKSAINTWYSSRPACLWADSIKFPVQADTSNVSKTSGYDALVDQGLLTRSTAEKKVFIIASKQVTNYDLSDKGRSAWTPDQQQPGFGNFCYGKPSVQSIDSSTPTTDQPGATTTVNYHYEISGAPGWATAAETQNAFPGIKTALAGPMPAIATLTNTTSGWAVSSGPARSSKMPASSADGSVVQ
jgi:hypothetical protein